MFWHCLKKAYCRLFIKGKCWSVFLKSRSFTYNACLCWAKEGLQLIMRQLVHHLNISKWGPLQQEQHLTFASRPNIILFFCELKVVNWGSACNAIQVEENEYDYTDGKRLESQCILSKCTYFKYFHFQITQINRNCVTATSAVQFTQSS